MTAPAVPLVKKAPPKLFTGGELSQVQPAAETPTAYGMGGTGGAPTQPTTPGAQVAQITPGQNDLRGTTITPGASDRLSTITSQTDAARNAYVAAPAPTPYAPVNAAGSPYTARADDLSARAAGSLPTTGYQAVGAGQQGSGQANSLLQQAIAAAGGVNPVGFSGDTTAARAQTMAALESLNSGPNRGEIASGYYDNLLSASAPQFEQDLRRVGQKASALGRVGAGMTTSDLGTVQQRREEGLSRARSGLALDAASREMEDRLNRVSAGQGVAGTFGNLDLGSASASNSAAGQRASLFSGLSDQSFGQDMDLRNEARGEQDRGLDYGVKQGSFLSDLGEREFSRGASLRDEDRLERGTQRDFELGDLETLRSRTGDLASLEDNQRGWEQSDRGELRGERDYQDYLSNLGIDRAIQQRGFEEDLQDNAINRDRNQTNDLYGMGYGTDPTGILGQQAQGYTNQANQDWQGAGDALGEYLAGQQPGMSIGTANQVIGSSTPQVRPAPYVPRAPVPVKPFTQPVQY